jgi:hypothetical protein
VNFDELATDRLGPARDHLGIHAAQKRAHERQREPTRVGLAQPGHVHVIGRASKIRMRDSRVKISKRKTSDSGQKSRSRR